MEFSGEKGARGEFLREETNGEEDGDRRLIDTDLLGDLSGDDSGESNVNVGGWERESGVVRRPALGVGCASEEGKGGEARL